MVVEDVMVLKLSQIRFCIGMELFWARMVLTGAYGVGKKVLCQKIPRLGFSSCIADITEYKDIFDVIIATVSQYPAV